MKVFFVSLGCDKNKVDSEKVLKFFMKQKNVTIVDTPGIADVAIVNTCSFIKDAKNESEDWIRYLVSLKRSGKIKKILILGCLATEYSRDKKMHQDVLSDVDFVLPLEKYIEGLDNLNDRVCDILSFSSFIKICDGCDKFCTYCIIPYLRGRFRSNISKNIIEEVKLLAKNGVKELSIVGQDTLNYGKDFSEKEKQDLKNNIKENDIVSETPFVNLINQISNVKGIEWIRLLYCYPESINNDVIKLIRDNEKVVPYIDMPVQHISDKILKSMNRKTSASSIRGTIYKLRAMVPDIVIRTTLMVGFPGETESDFEELKTFVREMKFDKLGVFAYSREKLSKSYSFPDQVNDKTKESRKREILDIQKNIVREKNKGHIGYVYNSLVEGFDTKKKMYVVRPYFNARGIDDNVYIKTNEKLISGTFVNAEIMKTSGMDLIARLV